MLKAASRSFPRVINVDVIPSIFILLALSYIYAAYGNVSAVAGAVAGFKPVVVAIVAEAVLKIGRRALSVQG